MKTVYSIIAVLLAVAVILFSTPVSAAGEILFGIRDMTPVKAQIELLNRIKPIKTLGHVYTSSEANAVSLAVIVMDLTTLMITHNMNHAIAYGNRLLMMDAGEIIIDVRGAEKARLTVAKLLEMFSQIRRQTFENDEVLLAGVAGSERPGLNGG